MIAALIAAAGVARAQNIDELVLQIVANSPELQKRAVNITADKYEAKDANSLSNPEVELSRVWGKDGVGNKLSLDVSQSFDWPGAYRSRSRANAMGEAAALQQLRADKLTLAQNAKQLLIELVYLRKQQQVLTDLAVNMRLLTDANAKNLEKGGITILDDKKAKLETYKLESQIAGVASREQEVVEQLISMAGGVHLSMEQVREYPLEALLSLQQYQDMAAEADPAVAAGNLSVRQSELSAKAATMSRLPSFTVGYEHESEMGDRFNGFTVGMTLPFFENRHARAAQKLRREAAEKMVEQTLADNSAEINAKYAAMSVWKGQIDMYRTLFGDNSYLALLKKAYDGGELNIIEYITEVGYYHENAMTYLELEYNYNSALCDLNKYNLLEYVN